MKKNTENLLAAHKEAGLEWNALKTRQAVC